MTTLAGVLTLLAIVDWIATVILVRASNHVHEPALTERATTAVLLSSVATIGAALAVLLASEARLPQGWTTLFLAACFVLVSFPQVWWLAGLWMGKFR